MFIYEILLYMLFQKFVLKTHFLEFPDVHALHNTFESVFKELAGSSL